MSINAFTNHDDMTLKLVDLERYPIANLGQGKGAVFLQSCQQQIDENRWCSFEGFIHADAVVALADDQIPADTMIQQLYESEILTEFVRRVEKF